jgi:hypothetical protein
MSLRKCLFCGGAFKQTHGSQRYCDRVCLQKQKTQNNLAHAIAENAKRTLIRFFTCRDCGKLAVHRAHARPMLRHPACTAARKGPDAAARYRARVESQRTQEKAA